MERLFAVRGATTLEADTAEQVVSRTQELLQAILERNKLTRDDIVSVLFTATGDITSEFPAAAARSMGLTGVPLMCARELDITSDLALPLAVRVMLHCYAPHRPDPVYLHGAAPLLEKISS